MTARLTQILGTGVQ
uniref:Uncharacterized protein n=1 Tax=Arundo donax TaxID=35708 RepID=A0A0A9A474_ARUDO